ncbi:MAG: class I adenylate-forming enzyme family protein, partial [Acidimicrobiales bacterium]
GVRTLSYGGGKMPLPVIRRALDLFPITNFVNAYGLTETSSTIALLGPDDHRVAQYSDNPAEQQRLASVGKVLPGVEISIRDDDGNELATGEVGEIFVSGEQVSGEYLEKGSLLVDGWFPTRDGGFIDADGYVFVQGRNDDVIIRGGENMSPGEIEDVVLSLDGVRDVAAIGVPCAE